MLLLAANVNNLKLLNIPELDKLSESIIRVRSNYESVNLNESIDKLKIALEGQKTKTMNQKTKNEELRKKLNFYNAMYKSLNSLSC